MHKVATLYNPAGLDFEFNLLKSAGFIVDFVSVNPDDGQAVAKALHGYEYIIASSERYSADVLTSLAASGLRLIVRMGVGYDRVDIPAARRCGVAVANTPGANSGAVAEHALMLTLAAARGVCVDNQNLHSGTWKRGKPRDLFGSTFGLMGFGNIARRYASLIRPMAGRILACDPNPDLYAAKELGVSIVGMAELLCDADVVSLHMPLTPETRGLFDRSTIHSMKQGAILINTSRGEIVDECALCDALRDGRLFGAGLDVYAQEPLSPDSPLIHLSNVVLTPHDASLTDAAFHAMTMAAVKSILSFDSGGDDLHRVD